MYTRIEILIEIKYRIKLVINKPTLNIIGSNVFNNDSIDWKNLGINWFKKANKKVHPNTTTNDTILPFSLPYFNWKDKDKANNNKAVDKIISVSIKHFYGNNLILWQTQNQFP